MEVQVGKKMNPSFQTVVNTFKPVANITHKQEVMRLYRRLEIIYLFDFYLFSKVTLVFYRCLRNLASWTENRELFNEEATKVRHQFNIYKAVGM